MHDCATLDGVTWRECLVRFAAALSDGIAPANALRMARFLHDLAPPPHTVWMDCSVGEDEYEAMLERREFEQAATALIGSALNDLLDARWHRRTPGGKGEAGMASIAMDPPLALLGAWTAFLLDRLDESPSLAAQAGASSHRSA